MTGIADITLDDTYHLITGRTTLMLNRFLVQKFKEANIPITKEQWSIMAVLWQQDGCSQQHLANQTDRDKPSTTRLLDYLEKDGYITRTNDQSDKRIKLIHLTPKGRSLEKQVNKVIRNTLEEATACLTDKKIKTIKRTFDKVYHHLNGLLK